MTQFYLLDSKEFCFPGQHAFKAAIRQDSTVTNAQPKFFRWTKTVDDILAAWPNFVSVLRRQDTRLACSIPHNACTSTSDAAEHDTPRNQCRQGFA